MPSLNEYLIYDFENEEGENFLMSLNFYSGKQSKIS